MTVKIEESWRVLLQEEFEKPYFSEIKHFVLQQKKIGKTVYPPSSLIFNAFNSTPFDKVKILILGQDPYHGEGQAQGLSFSVAKGIAPPPSLKNIFKELKDNYIDFDIPIHGDLESWASQGVLLLNSFLTVNKSEPGSHQKAGWDTFTDKVISLLSEKKEGMVFILWGKFAQQKETLIDSQKHLVLKAAHPSPYSASAGFFGCKHFILANNFLVKQGVSAIDWQLYN